MDMCLPKFDIYQGTIAPNCFNPNLGGLFRGLIFGDKITPTLYNTR